MTRDEFLLWLLLVICLIGGIIATMPRPMCWSDGYCSVNYHSATYCNPDGSGCHIELDPDNDPNFPG